MQQDREVAVTAAGFDSEKALIGGWTLEGADFQRVVESLSGNGSLSAAASGCVRQWTRR